MTNIIVPGQNILYMKIGVHASEPLESIIRRKRQEIEDEGYAMWGYGGGTCHPTNAVQPFAAAGEREGQKIYLCMKEMESHHYADQVRATHASVDGKTIWTEIPPGINVLGSRYALTIKNLREQEFPLSLSRTTVAIGNSRGKIGANYIAGRVDKACLQISARVEEAPAPDERIEQIGLVAELCPPYAVFLRNPIG